MTVPQLGKIGEVFAGEEQGTLREPDKTQIDRGVMDASGEPPDLVAVA
jgi:hypothetical protein